MYTLACEPTVQIKMSAGRKKQKVGIFLRREFLDSNCAAAFIRFWLTPQLVAPACCSSVWFAARLA